MRPSLYWDDFEKRAEETISCLKQNISVPVRRVAVFVTERCNLKCAYCNHCASKKEMKEWMFDFIVKNHGADSIIHVTGGEPSLINWLYPYIKNNGSKYRFHLNTNAVIAPPAQFVKRLKVSLDSCYSEYWNKLVGCSVFDTVVNNIKSSLSKTIVSITYTITKENYRSIPEFISFVKNNFEGLYAVFFSVYKGNNNRFLFQPDDVSSFFSDIKPVMDSTLDDESRALFNETIDEKFRIMQGVRFPENKENTCYLSLSERVFAPDGTMSSCSHLYRDGIKIEAGKKHSKCQYGCNRRLVEFNKLIEEAHPCAERPPQDTAETGSTCV